MELKTTEFVFISLEFVPIALQLCIANWFLGEPLYTDIYVSSNIEMSISSCHQFIMYYQLIG